jgi:hypothetical protein
VEAELLANAQTDCQSGEVESDESGFLPGSERADVAAPRRIRDGDHIRLVAGRPCLMYGQVPCDPHLPRFAQCRALSHRMSDEFTAVPRPSPRAPPLRRRDGLVEPPRDRCIGSGTRALARVASASRLYTRLSQRILLQAISDYSNRLSSLLTKAIALKSVLYWRLRHGRNVYTIRGPALGWRITPPSFGSVRFISWPKQPLLIFPHLSTPSNIWELTQRQ